MEHYLFYLILTFYITLYSLIYIYLYNKNKQQQQKNKQTKTKIKPNKQKAKKKKKHTNKAMIYVLYNKHDGSLRFHSFPVVDWFCLFICLWVLTFPSLSLVLLWQLFYLFCSSIVIHTVIVTAETLSRNERGRFGALKSDSTYHFFRNACTKSRSLRFSQFSGCWLILSVYILMSFDFPFVRLLGVR